MSALTDVQVTDGLPRARAPALVGAFTLLLIAGPFLALAFATHWSDFHLAPGDSVSIGISLGYSLTALVLIIAFGTPLAWWLARHSFRGKWLLESLILLALLTPPLAMGILLSTRVRAGAVLRSLALLRYCGPRRVRRRAARTGTYFTDPRQIAVANVLAG